MSSGNWLNNDGLYLKFGTSKATPATAGEYLYPRDGGTRVVEALIDLTTVGASPAVIEDNLFFPANMFIEQVEIVTETAATGTGAVLNIGFMSTDRSTEIDFNGLIAAAPQTDMTPAGEKKVYNVGSTDAGALIGTTIGSNPGYLCADYDTAAFTAGKIRVRVYYRNIATITQ